MYQITETAPTGGPENSKKQVLGQKKIKNNSYALPSGSGLGLHMVQTRLEAFEI